ncbi:hypothetical protein ACRAWF_28900 [Streptomyces sp. L7]
MCCVTLGMGLAVFRILAVMAVNAGFLFALTLHVQGGLGFSALRAGLTIRADRGSSSGWSVSPGAGGRRVGSGRRPRSGS